MKNNDMALPSDRAVVNGAASGSALRASVPSAKELAEKIVEAEKRVRTCEAALARASGLLRDLQTTHRVLFGVGGITKLGSGIMPTSKRQEAIIKLMGEGSENAKPPSVIYDEYWELGIEKINIETFRTTVWRMVNVYSFADWQICSDERGYWKERAKAMEARQGRDGEAGSVEDDSAVPEGFAQGDTP